MSLLHRIAHWLGVNGCVAEHRKVGPIGHVYIGVRCVGCDAWHELAHSGGCWCGGDDESEEDQEG